METEEDSKLYRITTRANGRYTINKEEQIGICNTAIQKLGKLEDLEERLGVPIEEYIKLLEERIKELEKSCDILSDHITQGWEEQDYE